MKALLLDLDGTLINSEKAFCNAFIDVLQNIYGVNVTPDEYKKYELENNNLLIAVKKKEYPSFKDISDDEVMSYVYSKYEDYFKKVIKEKDTALNFKLLKKIKSTGIKLALVTTCKRKFLNILFDEYNIYDLFECVIAREDILPAKLKPNPQAYLIALNKLKLRANETLCIEDSKRGIDAAIGANIPVIKVESFTEIKYHDERCLEEYSATKVLERILIEVEKYR